MNRNSLIKHIDLYKSKLGSYSAVARKCNINVGALSSILSGKYGADEARMLQKIAKELNYKESQWVIVPSISNYRKVKAVYHDAKTESMWFMISNKAGSGKTGTMEDLYNQDTSGSVVFIQAEEWSGRQFLLKLIHQTVGEAATTGKGYQSVAQLTDIVANYFNDMSLERPVLLIDEADKLKPAALRTLIPIFNRTEERLGVILSGTENLEKELKNGVRLRKKGYDELESRFGRTYIHLRGASEKEVFDICAANGVKDTMVQQTIWGELRKEEKRTEVKTKTGIKEIMLPYAEDFRLLKRLIKRELLIRNKG